MSRIPDDIQREQDIEATAFRHHYNNDLCEHGETFAACEQGCGVSELRGEVSGLRNLVTELRTMVRERDQANASSR